MERSIELLTLMRGAALRCLDAFARQSSAALLSFSPVRCLHAMWVSEGARHGHLAHWLTSLCVLRGGGDSPP